MRTTIEERGSELELPSRYSGLIPPALPLRRTFYPLGFPCEFATGSPLVMQIVEEMWAEFAPIFAVDPLRVHIEVANEPAAVLPPNPVFRLRNHLFTGVCDSANYSLGDLDRGETHIMLSSAAEGNRLWMEYFLVGPAPLCQIAGRSAVAIHAACVALEGCSVLLCGNSGEGKSSLAFACARRGWSYITDDASYLVHGRGDHLVTGNCYQLRFRPSAAELFPEVRGREETPRAGGKPSIEVPTASLPEIVCRQTARVGFMVFLNRGHAGAPALRSYRREAARDYLHLPLFGTPAAMERHYVTSASLLNEVEILELRYQDLNDAIDCLEQLVISGGSAC